MPALFRGFSLTSNRFVCRFTSAVGNLSTKQPRCSESSVFTDDSPIFQQLASLIADDIVAGTYTEESAVPSTYDYAVFYKMSPATAAKGVNVLVEQGVLYKKRGVGMFVASGARELLLARRRAEFHNQYIAPLVQEAKKLGIDSVDLKGMIDQEDAK
jgi:GntR family transcriptional regulator